MLFGKVNLFSGITPLAAFVIAPTAPCAPPRAAATLASESIADSTAGPNNPLLAVIPVNNCPNACDCFNTASLTGAVAAIEAPWIEVPNLAVAKSFSKSALICTCSSGVLAKDILCKYLF